MIYELILTTNPNTKHYSKLKQDTHNAPIIQYLHTVFQLPIVTVFPPLLMKHCGSNEKLSSINKSWYYRSAAWPDGGVERERDAGLMAKGPFDTAAEPEC